MRKNRKIKLVFFDSGDIILKIGENKIQKEIDKFYSKYGVNLKLEHRIWKKYEKKVNTGKMGHFEANKLVVKSLGLPISVAREFMKLDKIFWKKHVSLFRGERETLERLKREGYKLGILSDSSHTGIQIRKFYRYHRIDKFFDKIFSSRDVGYRKPDPRSYMRILRSFGIKSRNAVFVCHDMNEILGAKRIGLKIICFGGKHSKEAHYNAKKFSDIYEIIKKINRDLKEK